MNVQIASNASNPNRITSWMTSSPVRSWRIVLTDAPSSACRSCEGSGLLCVAVLIQIKRPPVGHGLPYMWPSRLPDDACGVRMSDVAAYAGQEHLRDGVLVKIRALRPEDEADMLAALEQTSAQSLQRRFFVMKRHFSDKERAFFMDIDFRDHVALVARAEQAGSEILVGGSRYIVFEPGRAEMAFMVVDAWQGRGVGSMLMRHLIKIASEAGIRELTAEILPENTAMLKVFRKFGFKPATRLDPQTVHLALTLA
jgi:RimJ/RimL family protein N-acetyltransferase